MPKPTLQELKARLHRANDDFHEAVDETLSSEHVKVEHKADIGSLADGIFDLMHRLNSSMDSL